MKMANIKRSTGRATAAPTNRASRRGHQTRSATAQPADRRPENVQSPRSGGTINIRKHGASSGEHAPEALPSEREAIFGVYREMLTEFTRSSPTVDENNQRTKRRRVGERSANAGISQAKVVTPADENRDRSDGLEQEAKPLQETFDADMSDDNDADEDNMEWEDVDISAPASAEFDSQLLTPSTDKTSESNQDIQITLRPKETEKKARGAVRRKGVTGQEKKNRLWLHKMHVLCLICHAYWRNEWCNDRDVQVLLLAFW